MIVEFNCEVCGTAARVRRAAGSPKPVACSWKCRSVWLTGRPKPKARKPPRVLTGIASGPRNSRWRGDIPRELKCQKCGAIFATGSGAGLAQAQGRKFCGRKCGPGFKWSNGADNPNWVGGPEARKARGTRSRSCLQQRNWSRAVLRRDDYTCQFCGQRGGDLHADHIKPFRDFPELRWELSNGRTLCRPCHYTTFRRSQKTG